MQACLVGRSLGPLFEKGDLTDVERDLIRTRTAEGRSRAQKIDTS
jgi:hypothetical protein